MTLSTGGFFQSSFFAGKYSLKIILKQYFYYLHNNIFKMSKCFLPYLIYMIHPWCVISFCSFSSSQAQALFLNHDESSNGWLILKCNSFLALRQFCRICSVCRFILRAVSWVWCGWVDFKFQNIYVIVTSLLHKLAKDKSRNLSRISKTLRETNLYIWPSNYVLTGVLHQKRR